MTRASLLVIALTAVFFSCTKESDIIIEINEPNPSISKVPAIAFESVNKTEVKAYQDSLVFTIKYTDGDGDLGSLDADEISIELVDQRNPNSLIFKYHLQPLAPYGSKITIQGTLNIVLRHTILLDENNATEQTSFTLRLKDRAGQWSNVVGSGAITVLK